MPQKSSKKDHKCSRHAAIEGGSRWHKFHFSGKVIVCSCILGFMLILVGGILFAIGQDEDEDTKPNQFDDVRKRPPMVYVGPVLMGIGVFIVIVGILMCLFETNVCRKRSPDASPLINAEAGLIEVKDSEGSATGYDAVQTSPRHKHKKNGGKKPYSSKKPKGSKKPHANSEKIPIAGTSAEKETPRNVLTASDKFLTPPSSFRLEVPVGGDNPSGKDSQVRKALLQSLTSSEKSFTASAEFQTPTASFVDDPMTRYMGNGEEVESSRDNHKFLSPMQSNASILSDSSTYDGDDTSNPDLSSKHEFLTPQNSNASILSDETPNNISPVQFIPNDHQVIEAEINVTEKTSVLPKETQEGASSSEEKSEILREKLDEDNLISSLPEISETSAQTQEASSSVEKLEILSEKLNEENLINSPVEDSETTDQTQEEFSSLEKTEKISEKLNEENLINSPPEVSETTAHKQEGTSSFLENSEILSEKRNEENLTNPLPEDSETAAQTQEGEFSSLEKSESLSEKLNEKNCINSPPKASEPVAVSIESANLLTNDSEGSSESGSKTLQDDSVGDSNKEIHDEKTEKESSDLVQ